MFSSSGSTVTLAQLQRAFLHRTSTAIGAMFFVRAMQPHVPLGQASSLTQIMLPHVPLAYVRLVCFPILPMLDTGSAGRSDAPVPEVLGSLSRCPCHDAILNAVGICSPTRAVVGRNVSFRFVQTTPLRIV